jgi:hypothetical protein
MLRARFFFFKYSASTCRSLTLIGVPDQLYDMIRMLLHIKVLKISGLANPEAACPSVMNESPESAGSFAYLGFQCQFLHQRKGPRRVLCLERHFPGLTTCLPW